MSMLAEKVVGRHRAAEVLIPWSSSIMQCSTKKLQGRYRDKDGLIPRDVSILAPAREDGGGGRVEA